MACACIASESSAPPSLAVETALLVAMEARQAIPRILHRDISQALQRCSRARRYWHWHPEHPMAKSMAPAWRRLEARWKLLLSETPN